MPYVQYTRGQLTSDIQSLITDTSGVYWTVDDIHAGINEFMRDWSAMTGYWRQRVTTPAPIGTSNPWIDLSQYFPAQRPRTVTVDQICREIQAHLCEPQNGISGTGMTIQFAVSSILDSIVRARNQFVLDAQFPLTVHQSPVSTPPDDDRFYLPDNTLIVNRAYWTAQGYTTSLQQSDSFAQDSFNPFWPAESAARPAGYSMAVTRPTEMSLFPSTNDSGALEYLSVDSNQLDPLDDTTTLGIPDDFTPAVKYYAMADLLSIDAETYDAPRAIYCKKRYDNYVQAAKVQDTALRVYVNKIPAQLGTLTALDRKYPYWRSKTGKPNGSAVASEIVVVHPIANSTYGIGIDIVTAAPVPLTDADFIDLAPGEISTLVGYVQHYLTIKAGGAELVGTMPQYDFMQKMAAQRNSLLNAEARYMTALYHRPNLELSMTPNVVDVNA